MSKIILGKVKEDVNAFGKGFALKVKVSDTTTRFQLNTKSVAQVKYEKEEALRAIPLYAGLDLKYLLLVKHKVEDILKYGLKVSKSGIFSNKNLATEIANFVKEEGIIDMNLVESDILVHTEDGMVTHTKAELEDLLQKQLDIPCSITVFELTK